MHGNQNVMDPNAKKAKKREILKLGRYLKPHLTPLIIATIVSFGSSLCSVFGPRQMAKITDECYNSAAYHTKIDLDYVGRIGFILIGIYLITFIGAFLASYFTTGAVQKATKTMRNDISIKINNLPLAYFDSVPYGDTLSRVTNDVDTISQNLNQTLSQIVSSLTLAIGVTVMMFTTSWILSLVALATLPVMFLLIGIVMAFSQKHFKNQQAELGQLNGHIEEAYAGHAIIKAFNMEDKNLINFDSYNNKLEKSAFKSQFYSGLIFPVINFVGNLGFVFIAAVGCHLVLSSNDSYRISVGDITAFMSYMRLFNQPLQQISQISSVMQACAAATGRIMDFLAQEELPVEINKEVLDKNTIQGNVVFDHVNFGYTKERTIIKDFSCNALPGKKIAIVGPTGAGKTTIVNLLMRFYEVNSGTISIDGVKTTDITRENVASLFGMVLQDTWLFSGTIMENLKYGNQDATYEEVKEACKACHVHHFIKTLTNGYDHQIGENTNISQGQRQLLTIARAMIENAPMLILDEATSSVDTRTEIMIQEAMDKLMEHRTSFVIAHRLSTIKNADIILVMKNGDIIEQGSHDELMKKQGFYMDLYNSQFAQ